MPNMSSRFERSALEHTLSIALVSAASIALFGSHSARAAESVTGIITDFGGFYESYQGNVSSTRPDSAHNLLGFEQLGILYSTGVNDQILTANSVPFTTSSFKALVPFTFTANDVGQGALDDGSTSGTGPVYPIVANDITRYMVDGVNGLGFSTFGNNVGTTINFNLSKIDIATLSDAAPEFLYFNNAEPSGKALTFKLFDVADNQLGSTASSIENSHPSIADVKNDRYETTPPFNVVQKNQNISVQGFTISLSDFGVTAAELAIATRLEVSLPPQADPPFIAYNADSLIACAVGDFDNDGVCDLVEGTGDTDGDGITDDQDTDSDNDSIPDIFEDTGDTDGDSVPDYLDTDSDGDGIVDNIEDTTMPIASGVDSDNDGIDDVFDVTNTGGVDANANGFDDTLEPTDTDNDGIPDYLDSDADGDSIQDSEEGIGDLDSDGTPNYLDTDSDGDGIDDAIEGVVDTDGDGIIDAIDFDADNDGIPDEIEGSVDTDGDGVIDALDIDSDNDGLLDSDETAIDSDGDGISDYRDLDSDNDGMTDTSEAGGADTDGDGIVDDFLDADGDGWDDAVAVAPLPDEDFDNDGIVDHLDVDSDNDGLPDLAEANDFAADSDGDGQVDDFLDANGDGLDDSYAAIPFVVDDVDADGSPDHLDFDTDNDGLLDLIEAGGVDANGDGIVDAMADSDADGIPDSVDVDQTGGADADADGIDDSADADFVSDTDTDNDGIVDSRDSDPDGDGFVNSLSDDNQNLPVLSALPDTDGDGTPDVDDSTIGAASPGDIIHTGLSGSGCSIGATRTGSIDPTLLLLALLALGLIVQRRLQGGRARFCHQQAAVACSVPE